MQAGGDGSDGGGEGGRPLEEQQAEAVEHNVEEERKGLLVLAAKWAGAGRRLQKLANAKTLDGLAVPVQTASTQTDPITVLGSHGVVKLDIAGNGDFQIDANALMASVTPQPSPIVPKQPVVAPWGMNKQTRAFGRTGVVLAVASVRSLMLVSMRSLASCATTQLRRSRRRWLPSDWPRLRRKRHATSRAVSSRSDKCATRSRWRQRSTGLRWRS